MPRRSRGCQECRRRRVGCDGGLPSCRQCIITNRCCSGPVQGPIVIDQTGSVTSRHARSPSTHLKPRNFNDHRIVRQVSSRPIRSLAFISHVISSVAAATASPSRFAWLRQLQGIPQAERGPGLDLSLQAVSLAYCAVESKNDAAAMESCRMYGEAMLRHSRALSRHSGALRPVMLYTTVMLAFFETLWSSDAAAYASHLTAARNMVEFGEWEATQDETLRQVAVLVQNQTLFMLIASPLDDSEVDSNIRAWSRTPYNQSEESQSVADQLIIQLFRLWKLVCAQKGNDDPEKTALDLRDTSSSIEKIWDACQGAAILRDEAYLHDVKNKAGYRDALTTALLVAYFAAAQIMLSLAGPLVLPRPFTTFTDDPCQAILQCTTFLFQSRAYLNCVGHDLFLPLTVVALYGTSPRHRSMARGFLEDQADGVAFKGVRAIVVQLIKSLRTQDASSEETFKITAEKSSGRLLAMD